ncbi:hypothetical protein [Arcanobacterium canis]
MSQIAELASLCGVSEQAIRKYCSQHKFRKLRNQWNLTKAQYLQVLSHYGAGPFSQPTQPSSATSATAITGSRDEEIERLWQQVEELNKGMKELRALLAQQQKLLAQEQQLHAITKQELSLLLEAGRPETTQEPTGKVAQPVATESEKPVKRGWLSRLFG